MKTPLSLRKIKVIAYGGKKLIGARLGKIHLYEHFEAQYEGTEVDFGVGEV